MRHKLVLLIIPILATLAITSCCKRKRYCQGGNIKIAFVGFQRSEIRSLVLRRYDVDDTVRTKALDSAQLSYTGTSSTTPGKKDTVWFADYTSNGVIGEIYYGSDYTIKPTSIANMFYVSGILDEGHKADVVKCSDNETSCVNNVKAFTLNGRWTGGNVGYIVK